MPTDILVTEGCRGDGGTLLDVNEYRFMPDYEPEKAELASRDVVSRRMTEHMRKGFGVPSPTASTSGWTSATWAKSISPPICGKSTTSPRTSWA